MSILKNLEKHPIHAVVVVSAISIATTWKIADTIWIKPREYEILRLEKAINELSQKVEKDEAKTEIDVAHADNQDCNKFSTVPYFSEIFAKGEEISSAINRFNAWGSSNACLSSIKSVNGKVGECIEINYDIRSNNAYAVWEMDLKDNDITKYRSLSFFMKGDVGGESVNIHFIDGKNQDGWVEVDNYSQVTSEWQNIRIDLKDLLIRDSSMKLEYKRIMKIQFAFQWQIMKGKIFIDELNLTK